MNGSKLKHECANHPTEQQHRDAGIGIGSVPSAARGGGALLDFELTEADMQAIEPLNRQDTGFRDFGDPNYLRRIIAMFPNV